MVRDSIFYYNFCVWVEQDRVVVVVGISQALRINPLSVKGLSCYLIDASLVDYNFLVSKVDIHRNPYEI